ncbi:MAG TPA: oxidoreductase [Candidatus Dormibacteraeota bacterium]|nr:oxidoreductase [Candidatus Dormibacteraeota bacterium]
MVPDPGLTPTQMIERATRLRPHLLACQEECERLRTLPDTTREAFLDAGFYRILQPRRFGGYELGLDTFTRVMVEIARGCPSSGWTLALTAGHAHTVSRWPLDAQAELFGDAGDFRCTFVLAPGATAERVDGGYVVRGAWDYGTGCDVATHFMGNVALVADGDDAEPEPLVCVLPRADFTIVDNWDALGLRGTGSKRVVVSDRFVPAARAVPQTLLQQRVRPLLHENPLYAGPVGALLFLELAAVAVGVARGTLDEYEALLRRRTTFSPPPVPRFEHHEHQRYFGEAAGLIDLAEAGVQRAARDYTELCRRDVEEDVPFDELADRRLLLYQQRAVRSAVEAVDLLFRTAGTSATRPGERLQRYFRDMSTIRTHITMQYDRTAENYARLYFGLPPASPM